jgi:hypothetical protein
MNIKILISIIAILFLTIYIVQRVSLSKTKIDNVPPIVVSLTTSPKRIHSIQPVINSILSQTIPVSYIQLNLPKVFKRSGETFETIPSFLHHDKIKIRFVEDIGPITKILPTLQEKFTHDTLVLSIDDDTIYGNNMIEMFLKYHKQFPNHVLTGSGHSHRLSSNQLFPLQHQKATMIEGFSGVLYPYKLFQNIKIDTSNVPKECYFSDDFVLSNYIHIQKIPITSLEFFKFPIYKINQLHFGFHNDALHKSGNGKKETTIHPQNYKTCAIHYDNKKQLSPELSYWLL